MYKAAVMITVLLADCHQLVRVSIRAVLEQTAGFRVVAEASDGSGAVDQFAVVRPDVAVMDMSMAAMNNWRAVRAVLSIDPAARVLILAPRFDPLDAAMALRAGATGYISKRATVSELANALRSVSCGRCFLQQEAEEVQAGLATTQRDLSKRESQILLLIANGRREKDIAQELRIEPQTVSTYLARAAIKLGLTNSSEICRFAVKYRPLLYTPIRRATESPVCASDV